MLESKLGDSKPYPPPSTTIGVPIVPVLRGIKVIFSSGLFSFYPAYYSIPKDSSSSDDLNYLLETKTKKR